MAGAADGLARDEVGEVAGEALAHGHGDHVDVGVGRHVDGLKGRMSRLIQTFDKWIGRLTHKRFNQYRVTNRD